MRIFRFERRIGAVGFAAAVAVLGLIAAGCGGGKSSSATTSSATTSSVTTTSGGGGKVSKEQWADNFCSAVYTWGTTIRSIGQSFPTPPTKEALQSAADDFKSANEKLVSDLKSLGTPDLPGGQQARVVIDQLAGDLKNASDKIDEALSNLSSGTDVANAASVFSSTFVAIGTSFRQALTQLRSINEQAKGSFKDALKTSSSCQKLRKAGSS
jgi:hypothetical protein